jgi:hypothetical protein
VSLVSTTPSEVCGGNEFDLVSMAGASFHTERVMSTQHQDCGGIKETIGEFAYSQMIPVKVGNVLKIPPVDLGGKLITLVCY